ncbi:hypothetical protein V1509DRAFT_615391 [Lipomyces kononenkoae]
MATNDLSNADQLAAHLIQRQVPSPPPLISTESVSSSGLATPLSALSTSDVVDDADLSEPSTAGSNTSGHFSAANVPSRPESRSSTLSGISTTAVKDGIEGRRVHHRNVEIKPSIATTHHHHHHYHHSHAQQGDSSNFQHTSTADPEQSQSSTSDSHHSISQTPTSSSTSSSNVDDLDRSLRELSAGSKPLYDDYEEYTNRLAQT